jgi:UDP-N-acetylglucosamine--N-acetylmuramyl-(pentapeptide) pyrophosphoryl-undecaprenol N-acetylglucosamine transferase
MKIVMTGGGTAGHVTANLALIPFLRKDGWQIDYIGGSDGMERALVEGIESVTYHGISTGKLRRYFDVKNLSDPFRVLRGLGQARRVIRQIKPDVVFSKGGFVSVPVVYAAAMNKVPVVSHESDMTPGLANKLNAPFTSVICTTFPETASAIKRGVFTGTPLRKEIFSGDRSRGLGMFGFDGKKPVLLMTGGSQGAAAVNNALRGALDAVQNTFDVLHLCGKGKLDAELKHRPGYRQVEFLADAMPHAFACADMVLSRAGANSLCELLALRKPHLLVPYPKGKTSRGDQVDNALSFERRGFSRVLWQEDLTSERLAKELEQTWRDRQYFIDRMKKEPSADGTQAVLREIVKAARK